MVIDEADGLHIGVDDGGADEFEAAFFEILADFFGKWSDGGNLLDGLPVVDDGLAVDESPKILVEGAEFLLDCKKAVGVGDGGGDFEAVFDDAVEVVEFGLFGFGEFGNFGGVEVGESLAVTFAFIENGGPRKTGLGTFEDEEFEEGTVVMDRHTPFLVVIIDV